MKTQLFFLFMFALSAGKIFAQPALNPKPADLLETNFSEHTLIENLFEKMADGKEKPSHPYSKNKNVAVQPLSLIALFDSVYYWTWMNSYQYTYTYDANNNQISRLSQNWNGSSWVNSSRATYTYDVNNNRIKIISQAWNGNLWENYSEYNYTYDANNFRTSYVHLSFNNTGISSLSDSAHYYFHAVTEVNDLITKNYNLLIYPNPFSIEFNVSVSGKSNGEIVLCDMLGKEILRETISKGETKFHTEKLLPGFYLLNYIEGNKTECTKLVKF